jgi:hypothetical protein
MVLRRISKKSEGVRTIIRSNEFDLLRAVRYQYQRFRHIAPWSVALRTVQVDGLGRMSRVS